MERGGVPATGRRPGCEGVVIYQETYHPETYAPGPPRRAEAPLRLAAARPGARRPGPGCAGSAIGALFGLHDDWRYEAHRRRRARPVPDEARSGGPQVDGAACRGCGRARPGYQPHDAARRPRAVQLVCALRLALPDAGIVLSTREAPAFRDGLFRVGVTHTSAGSHTEPGGYTHPGRGDRAVRGGRSPIARPRSPRRSGSSGTSRSGRTGRACTPATEAMLSPPRPAERVVPVAPVAQGHGERQAVRGRCRHDGGGVRPASRPRSEVRDGRTNGEPLERARTKSSRLTDGDRLELVRAVAGG